MISQKSLNLTELTRMIRNAVILRCNRSHLPQIPVVVVDPQRVDPNAYAAFDFARVELLVPSNLPKKLASLSHYTRVWLLNNAVVHEIQHYKQYLQMKRRK